MKTDILIVIPYFNHPATLRQVAVDCLAVHDQVLVIDDGSDVPAGQLLKDLPVHVISHHRNLGKGVAILSAANYAVKKGKTHLITIDADGQHQAGDLKTFLQKIRSHPYTLFVGKRDFESANAPRSARFGRYFSNFWYFLQTRKRLGDCQSGYRAYPLTVLKEIKIKSKRYNFEIEVLVRSTWAGVDVGDVPISVYYPSTDERITHFHRFWDNLRLVILNTRLTIRSLMPWPYKKLKNISNQK